MVVFGGLGHGEDKCQNVDLETRERPNSVKYYLMTLASAAVELLPTKVNIGLCCLDHTDTPQQRLMYLSNFVWRALVDVAEYPTRLFGMTARVKNAFLRFLGFFVYSPPLFGVTDRVESTLVRVLGFLDPGPLDNIQSGFRSHGRNSFLDFPDPHRV